MKANANMLFECSWEVCNKVGGINSVIKTKAPYMRTYYTQYFLVGPYFEDKAAVEFLPEQPPEALAKAFKAIASRGVNCHYGTWQIRGEPNAILIDFSGLVKEKDHVKAWLWEEYMIDSLNAGWEFEEPMLWSYACGLLLEALPKQERVVIHCHEWLSGTSALYLKKIKSPCRSVFQTHATILGRTIAGSQRRLFSELTKIKPDEEAKNYNIQSKHLLEKACAHNASVFATVSAITSIEAEHLLGKKADVILPNGLNMEHFPTIEETSVKHVASRDKLRELFTYYFFPYYNFSLEHTIAFFIMGRYEYHNKGIDIMIKALGELNRKLQKEKSEHTVVVLFWIPMRTYGIKLELLENKNYYRHIKHYVEWNSSKILKEIVSDLVCGKFQIDESVFSKDFILDLKKDLLHFKRAGNPPLATHNIQGEEHDPILTNLLAEGLDNKEEDRVKVIVYPVYMDGNDGLLNLPLYDAIAGCHFGLFPSYYEPWGYTPMETAANGVAALTTDLAGFGRFIQNKLLEKDPGIHILPRFGKSKDEEVKSFFEILHSYAKYDHAQRVANKINAKNLSNLCDWKHFVKSYTEAHNLALTR